MLLDTKGGKSGIWKDVNPSITHQPAIEIVWRMEGVTQLVPVDHHLSMVGLIFTQHCWYYVGSLCPIGASGSDNKETHLKKNMKRQNNLYTLNGRFLSSSLQRNPSFASITNVRFLSTN